MIVLSAKAVEKRTKDKQMTSIKFATNKAGTQIAFEWHNSAMRWVRISLDKANFLIATSDLVEVVGA